MDAISKYHNSKIIHGWYISILMFFFVNIICILTLESNFYFYFFHVKFQGTTKEAFDAYAIRLVFETSLIIYSSSCNKSYRNYNKVSHHYGILLVHFPRRNNYRYSFSAHTHHFCIKPL